MQWAALQELYKSSTGALQELYRSFIQELYRSGTGAVQELYRTKGMLQGLYRGPIVHFVRTCRHAPLQTWPPSVWTRQLQGPPRGPPRGSCNIVPRIARIPLLVQRRRNLGKPKENQGKPGKTSENLRKTKGNQGKPRKT